MELRCSLLGVWEASVVSWAESAGQVAAGGAGSRGRCWGSSPPQLRGHVSPSGQSKLCLALGRTAGKVVQPCCARSVLAARGQAPLAARPESHVESVND